MVPAKAIAKLEPEFAHNWSCTAQLKANNTQVTGIVGVLKMH